VADNRWPELENAYPALAALYPKAQGVDIQPMGWFERLLGGSKNVATTEGNKIRYNADAGRRDGRPPEQILAHELEHVQQNAGRGFLQNIVARFRQGMQPYAERPDEMGAMAAEARPTRRNGDVRLPPSVQAIK
jgi:hypothetical protein